MASSPTPGPRLERLSSLKHPRRQKSFTPAPTSQSASGSACPNPSCSTADIQEMDGERVCISCGTIINDANIVSEVAFGETSTGAAVVQGAAVGEGQRYAKSSGQGFRRLGGSMGSREQTEYHGTRKARSSSQY